MCVVIPPRFFSSKGYNIQYALSGVKEDDLNDKMKKKS